MSGMRRYAKWIALVVVVAMVSPFLAQGLGGLLSMDPVYVAVVLLAATVAIVFVLARPGRGEEED